MTDLAIMGAISLAVVALLMMTFTGQGPERRALPGDMLTVIALVCAMTLVTGVTVLQFVRSIRRDVVSARAENTVLRQRLAGAESILKAEPQILIHWEPGQPLSVVTHALTSVPGVPGNHRELVRFGVWLEPQGAGELKAGLDALFEGGRAFSVIVKTIAGGHLEAEGRTAGGRAILRMRDVAGYKRELARIVDTHSQLARDIEAGRALLNSLPSPAWIKGNDGRIVWVNRAYRLAVDAASDLEVRDRQIELLETRQRQSVETALTRGITYRERLPLMVGGVKKQHELVVLPVTGGQAAVALDITAVEQAQGELDRQSAAYERTLDKVATAVAIFSPDRKLAYFNEAYHRLWQADAAWLKTQPVESALLDRLRDLGRLPETANYREWKARFLTHVRSGANTEEVWHLPDGRTLQVLAESREDGGITYLYVDQTERLAHESRYNQQIKSQRETLDSLKEGVAVFGTDGRLKFNNTAFAAIWKLDEDIAESKPHIDAVIDKVAPLHDDPDVWHAISGAITSFCDDRVPLEGTMAQLDQTMIAYAAMPLPDGATLVTFTDITDSKRYERALEERNEALITADRLKSQFIGHVSYELRTPLTNIIGFNELLSSPLIGPLNPKQREYLSDITSSSKALLAIIDDILDLATIDAGAVELKLTPVSVARVIDAAIEGVRDRAIQSKLTIDIGQAEGADEFVADEARVCQVLYNLVSNAVGFSKVGDTIEINAWRESGMMMFCVIDNGLGVPKEQQARVFERFESRSQGSKHRGAGLGLSIVKNLVDLHGGTVKFESEPGRGTKVVVAFPERADMAAEFTGRAGKPEATNMGAPGVYIPGLKPSVM
ncbi:MAG: ATP-binding protein [Hyphomicrobiaceae bacterium]